MFRRKRGRDKTSANVRLVGRDERERATYIIYSAARLAAALDFLRQTPVTEEFVYLIVETPQGNIGRDLVYIFDESDGTPLALAPRPASSDPTPSETHCAWCGHFVVPVELPRLRFHEVVSSVATHVLVEGPLYKRGHGFSCEHCGFLQCAVCSGMTNDDADPPMPTCRSCGRELRFHMEDVPLHELRESSRLGPNGEIVLFPDDPLGDETWGLLPLKVPWTVDVEAFLAQPTLPYLWPGDDRYESLVADWGADARRMLRASWINVYLHHPNPDVVSECLRVARPDSVYNMTALADLLASPTAEQSLKTAASVALWALDSEPKVRMVLNLLLSRGLIASDYSPQAVHQALAELWATCPAEKARWFEEQLDDGEDD
ncbi:hypothetical protein APR04_002721 [Promicromonospora umidemergens]|nr:hypothetical protein [Promicromonospora umidemergens]MCP2283808.1 hypothetical protein [Promicromonospora umidemergens]